MAEVVIYSTDYCPYCKRAKELLSRKGAAYKEIDVTNDEKLRAEMTQKAGGRKTVPQIFVNGKHIGGFDDMNALDKQGKLDALLG